MCAVMCAVSTFARSRTRSATATIAAVAATRYIEELDAGAPPEAAEEVERLYVQA